MCQAAAGCLSMHPVLATESVHVNTSAWKAAQRGNPRRALLQQATAACELRAVIAGALRVLAGDDPDRLARRTAFTVAAVMGAAWVTARRGTQG